MTKTQKIWMWIFGAMFLIPEILWSPVLNFYYEFLQTSKTSYVQSLRNGFLQNPDNINFLRITILVEFIGVLLFLFLLVKNKNLLRGTIKYILIILFLVLALVFGFALFSALTLSIGIL